jgi:hypothetical protein
MLGMDQSAGLQAPAQRPTPKPKLGPGPRRCRQRELGLLLGFILALISAVPAGASVAKRILAESFTATW